MLFIKTAPLMHSLQIEWPERVRESYVKQSFINYSKQSNSHKNEPYSHSIQIGIPNLTKNVFRMLGLF